jgi:hypothetical protein
MGRVDFLSQYRVDVDLQSALEKEAEVQSANTAV